MKKLVLVLLALLIGASAAHAQLPPTNVAGIDFTANSAQSLSAAGHLRLRYNSGTNQLEQSIAGGAYTAVGSSVNIGNWVFTGNNTDLSGAGVMGVCNGATATSCSIGNAAHGTTLNSPAITLAANAVLVTALSAVGTKALSLEGDVSDAAGSVAVAIRAVEPTTTGAIAGFYENFDVLRGVMTPLSSDGFTLADGVGTAHLSLSTNIGAILAYSSATFSAGAGSVSFSDGTGAASMSAGVMTFTIFSGISDADNTRNWGTLADRWSIGGFARLIQGEQNLAFSATPAFNCTTSNAIHIGPITGNITGPTMVSGSAGEHCTIMFLKDGTAGTYSITSSWGSNVRTTASTFTSGAGSLVILHFFWDANLATPAWVEQSGLAFN